MIDCIIGWFKITQYNYKRVISIVHLVENKWLSRHPIPMEITYDQGSEFIGHEFSKSPNKKKYGITAKPSIRSNIALELQCHECLVWQLSHILFQVWIC